MKHAAKGGVAAQRIDPPLFCGQPFWREVHRALLFAPALFRDAKQGWRGCYSRIKY